MVHSQKPVVVVGSINMDLVATTPKIPIAGQTVTGSGFVTTPGGKGANQAVAVAKLGYPVHMIGAVGDDVFAQTLIDNLTAAGVNTNAVRPVPGPSGVAPIAVADNGENSIIVVPGANAKVTPETIDTHLDLIRGAGMVLCQLELPLATVSYAIATCAKLGVPVMLDPAPAAELPGALWRDVTWFTPNETESALYVKDQSGVEAVAESLLKHGVHGVALKRGSEGVYIATKNGESGWVRSFPVRAVDTVAAGDCFNGAFAVALLEGQPPLSAARFASAAAAISVTRRGAQTAMPTREEVKDFLSQHQ